MDGKKPWRFKNGKRRLTCSIFQTILQRCWVILKTTEKLPQAPPRKCSRQLGALWFQLQLRVSKCVKPHAALAHPASLPLTPGDTTTAAGCALKSLQSYHIANTTVLSKYSGPVTPSCHGTELSALLRFCCKSYSSYSCQVPVAGNWEICENMGCVPERGFRRALV